MKYFFSYRLARRALDEIPHHLSRLIDEQTADAYVQPTIEFSWLLAKLAASGVTQVIT